MEARRLQEQLREKVEIAPLSLEHVHRIAGVDAGYRGRWPGESPWMRAAVVEMDFPGLTILTRAVSERLVGFPYIPGLLSFRETPAILAALERLVSLPGREPKVLPDVLMVDGHGLAHPRRFGIASHLGVLLDLPVIGCAKSALVGEVDELGEDAGSVAELVFDGEVIGAAVRTRTNVRPVYVSVGHKTDLESAISLVLACCQGRRLPEPIRQAHLLANSPGTMGE